MLTYLAVAKRYRPKWLVWENVPGVLSIDQGRAFGALLRGLAELGYGFAYRILDAQYVRVDGLPFAVPQRRRRVFVVGHSDWRRAAAVLFESASLSGHPPPRRQAGQGIAGTIGSGPAGGRSHGKVNGTDRPELLTYVPAIVSQAMSHKWHKQSSGPAGDEVAHLVATAFKPSYYTRGKDGAPAEVTPPLSADADMGDQDILVADPICANEARTYTHEGENNFRLRNVVGLVRRLTPLECERLQGFPDGYTAIPYRGKQALDAPRYKALGNSMAVNCMRWLGTRIDLVEECCGQD
jgi:DNA (cytosine-5)-methyltransferase 1